MSVRPASFKSVPFYVEESDAEYGRRMVLHKYPYRDIPYLEDLGRDARCFRFAAFVMDQDAHNALVEALESPGGGTLIHPFYGSQFVTVAEQHARVHYPRCSGGRFEFDLAFVEAGENMEPDAQEDSAGLLESLIDEAIEAAGLDFLNNWLNDIAGWVDMAAVRIDSLLAALESYLLPAEKALAKIKAIIDSGRHMLSKPLELYYRISGLIYQITHIQLLPFGTKLDLGRMMANSTSFYVSTPIDAGHRTLRELSGQSLQPQNGSQWLPSSNQQPDYPQIDPLLQQSNRPQWTYPYAQQNVRDIPLLPPSLANAVRRNFVLSQAQDIATADYDSKADIIAARDEVIAQLDNELIQCTDEVFSTFQDVRAQVIQTATARLPLLRDTCILQSKAVQPALVLAYQVNGTIDGYEDVIARNHIRHPLFVNAGKVEVIRDAK